jgi:hypothetical protein
MWNPGKHTRFSRLVEDALVCSVLDWSMAQVIDYYDDRGACETVIQADKGGLKLCKRRKKRAAAQEALILPTDVGHNTLARMSHLMFPDGPLARFGTTRLIEDVLGIPGHLIFDKSQLVEVHLNELHPHAAEVAGLERLLDHFSYP